MCYSPEVLAMMAFVTSFFFYHGERMPDANEVNMNYHTKMDVFRMYLKEAKEKDFQDRHAVRQNRNSSDAIRNCCGVGPTDMEHEEELLKEMVNIYLF
jgi:hypothetical protein